MDPLSQIIFDDKSFSDLLKEIHKNQSKKSKQLAKDDNEISLGAILDDLFENKVIIIQLFIL